jgi:hypothetical protein
VIVGLISDEILVTINSIEILGIIYLAIAISKLRSDIAHLQGRVEQHDREAERSNR